jgi:hypothetical protein
MEFLIKSLVGMVLVVAGASSALFAQDKLMADNASEPDPIAHNQHTDDGVQQNVPALDRHKSHSD